MTEDIFIHVVISTIFGRFRALDERLFCFFNLALIFIRLLKQCHYNKYVLVFPATTVNNRQINDTDVNELIIK